MTNTDPTPGPAVAEAATSADIVTPHEEADPKATGEAEQEITPGIVDPRRTRIGPDILEPLTPGLQQPDSSV